MKSAADRSSTLPGTRKGWWPLGLGLLAWVVGPALGFGLVGLLVALAALVTGISGFRRGERSWMLWVGLAFAIGVLCYLPFMATDYPYTTP